MKKFSTLLPLLLCVFILPLSAQDEVTVSVGPSYSNHSFYTIADDAVTTLANEAWELAFSTVPGDGGIFLNEATKAVFSGAVPNLELWLAPTNEFSDVVDLGLITDSLYNTEADWSTGAFNSMKDELDPSDFGWGFYSVADDVATGIRVYVIKMRDDSWKKIFVESMEEGVFTMKYADLDGANETTVTIDKADYAGSPLALFSFGTNSAVASPAGWDFLFTRYIELQPQGVQYQVTGVLSADGIEIAEARGIDPATVNYEDYLDSMQTEINVIGQDWRYFDLTSFAWIVQDDRAYFAKLPNNDLWKMVFTNFAGSGSGDMTFEKTFLTTLSGVEENSSNFSEIGVFPNPATDAFSVALTIRKNRDMLALSLVNTLGQEMWSSAVRANTGLNVWNVNATNVPSGIYYLVIGDGKDVVTTKVRIQN